MHCAVSPAVRESDTYVHVHTLERHARRWVGPLAIVYFEPTVMSMAHERAQRRISNFCDAVAAEVYSLAWLDLQIVSTAEGAAAA